MTRGAAFALARGRSGLVVDELGGGDEVDRRETPRVDAVVVEPWGAHPSYAQGYYDRDNAFYVGWEPISREAAALERYLDRHVYGVADRAGYLALEPGLVERLAAGERWAAGVNYGY